MFGNCLDEYYLKRTWYTQTFLCQFLCGRNKNQFFHYFSLLCDLLHHQGLQNKWFERRLKRMAMFLSIFGKHILPGCLYFLNSKGNFEMKWLWNFLIIKNSNFLYLRWVFCLDFSFSTFNWKFKIMLIRKYNQHFTSGVLQEFHLLHLKIFRTYSNQ